jgi:myosin V
VVGGAVTPFMLEKLRVTSFSERTERNFHAFYQFMAALSPEEKKSLSLRAKAKDMRFSRCAKAELVGVDEAAAWRRTLQALEVFGMTNSEVEMVKQIMAAILNIGELRYTGTNAEFSSATRQAGRAGIVENLLGLPTDALAKLFLEGVFKAKAIGSSVQRTVPRSAEEAGEVSECLAKLLYSRLFDELSKRINAHIETISKDRYDAALADAVEQNPHAVEPAFVSFMDLFGFEGTNRNGVQQFFVNYAR